MLDSDQKKIERIPLVLGRLVRSYRFALAAFLIPLGIRAIPEILVGAYPRRLGLGLWLVERSEVPAGP